MPVVRPFRALRFNPEVVRDLAAIVSPPYDVIGPEERARLVARDPRNVVRLDLPVSEAGEDPDERYRRAARTLAQWRSDGALRKDVLPSLYVYEQRYRVPGTDVERVQRGFFGRLRLEAFGPGSGVLPHERTLAAPREDRYRLLRATGVNTSPVVVLFPDSTGEGRSLLDGVVAAPPAVEATDDDGTVHRLWVVPEGSDPSSPVGRLAEVAGSAPVTIADGHHRYETALRYRDERRMSRSCEEDPPFDYLLTLFLPADSSALTVLPTHRVVHGLADAGVERLWSGIPDLFEVDPVTDRWALVERFMSVALEPGGAGRFGLWTRGRGALLRARQAAFDAVPAVGGPAARRLDVTVLGAVLERLADLDAATVAGGGRVTYTKSAAEAVERVEGGGGDADAVFLLEPTPIDAIVEVAAAGDVMPQKSTYFYPKALTGLVINPHEW